MIGRQQRDVVAPGQLDITGHGLSDGDGGGHGGRLRCGLGGRRPGGLQFLDVRLLRGQFLPEIFIVFFGARSLGSMPRSLNASLPSFEALK